ncbi:hypothetical protein P8C59_008728 [Phyllachora maydis]|uniref:Copper-fist domain-containing protein n=1 Tax=Phyllachora maydis TaxID=1825666 RepID=A0AAD9IB80_9PEZI|nr:hypothetical protein P8C59_008728 [Phyllachora maydis]
MDKTEDKTEDQTEDKTELMEFPETCLYGIASHLTRSTRDRAPQKLRFPRSLELITRPSYACNISFDDRWEGSEPLDAKMPFINGQKMACGPCIRGHRSTKCTHASERVMVPVRKPGRPLSSARKGARKHVAGPGMVSPVLNGGVALQLGHGHGNVASSTYTITAPLPSPARPLTFSHAHESESEQEAKDFGPLSAMTAAIPSWPTTSMDGAMNGSVKLQLRRREKQGGEGRGESRQWGPTAGRYGSWQNPINPTIWQQLFAQQQSMTLVPPLPGNGGEMAPAPNEGAAGTSHQCSCGPGCKCIGCLAHPYNSETLAYIQNAYENTGANEAATAHPPGSIPQGADMYVNGNGQTDGSVHDGVEVATATATAAPPHRGSIPVSLTTDTKATEPPPPSPPTAHTPSDASGISNEEQLPMTDFLFLDMPFDGTGFPTLGLDGCDGNYAACLCGPGCQCDGCEVHNRPGAT